MKINEQLLNEFYSGLDDRSKESLDAAAEKILETKRRGGKVVVATGSGPNLHEGVTTLIAELMEKGLVDGIPGPDTCYYVQVYAARFGGYKGAIDRILGPNTWIGFANGLETP